MEQTMESFITHVNNCEVRFGTNAGKEIEREIQSAKESVKIISPYISTKNIDILQDTHNRGVQVYLATSEGFTKNKVNEIKIYRDLIHQKRITNHTNKQTRFWGRILVLIGFVALFYFSFTNLNLFSLYWKWEVGIFLILLILSKILKDMRVYTYSYEPNLPFSVYVSPYENEVTTEHFFIHSKIFIIDKSIAFIGSVNFTYAGFYNNYETLIRIEDKSAIQEIEKQFEILLNSDQTYKCSIDYLGKTVYPEPKN
jgi:phosphatidylserine/phosphatidylglycerophosphate/cardiolipin synthase-like enzyme